jgi:hypothetical protein
MKSGKSISNADLSFFAILLVIVGLLVVGFIAK